MEEFYKYLLARRDAYDNNIERLENSNIKDKEEMLKDYNRGLLELNQIIWQCENFR